MNSERKETQMLGPYSILSTSANTMSWLKINVELHESKSVYQNMP